MSKRLAGLIKTQLPAQNAEDAEAPKTIGGLYTNPSGVKPAFLSDVGRAATIQSVATAAAKRQSVMRCAICRKQVYQTENIKCGSMNYHKGCFICGGIGESGCGKTLTKENYIENKENPYCKTCHGCLFGPVGKAPALATDKPVKVEEETPAPAEKEDAPVEETAAAEPVEAPVTEAADARAPSPPPPTRKFVKLIPAAATGRAVKMSTNAPKCTKCEKSVYQTEELLALGQTWHSTCFCCGGKGGNPEACGKVLNLRNFVEKEKEPYCAGCANKLFGATVRS